ncbi:Uma2 family endonuclease [Anabaena sp. CCY 9402-a]|uniref:Uma2 family endonuclease n=1 Tax=Anabaena sp. CCY 9402-a TaxID=3103867 RepID=UPI0039C5EBB4
MTVTIAKWTIDDYHRMIEAGILSDRKVELLQGEIIEMSPEGEPHAYCSHEAAQYLTKLLDDLADVRQAKPINLPNASEPEPDIAIVQRLGREYLLHHPYPENIFWVIEYSNSSLEKDLEIKNKIYAEAGILEYWVVNLRKLNLVVFRDILDGEYATKQTLTIGTIQPLAFPDISVAVEQIINR